MSKGVFITGTDTGVGKTIVTGAITEALRKKGINVTAVKPVESGVLIRDGIGMPQDAIALAEASESKEAAGSNCVYMLKAPVSPHLAARMEDVSIRAEIILDFLKDRMRSFDMVVAEGAGGLLVPLGEGVLLRDVIAKSGFGLVIVSPDILGTINSTLLTIEAARKGKIPVVGVILNKGPKKELGNREAIEKYGRVKVLGTFPEVEPEDDELPGAAALKHINLDSLLEI